MSKPAITDDILKQALVLKGHKMKRATWVRNVMKIHPEKTKYETEALYDKIFNSGSPRDRDLPSDSNELH